MPSEANERNRMIVDLPPDVQMAIRLAAVKSNITTGSVVCEAVQQAFSRELDDARVALAEQKTKPGTKRQKV